MTNPAKLESALRALYQSGLMIRPRMAFMTFLRDSSELKLWGDAMQCAKEALEGEPEKPKGEPRWPLKTKP